MPDAYEVWVSSVRDALRSINMKMDDWQGRWPFDFKREHNAGTTAKDAAMKANRYWWHEQNKSMGNDCRRSPNCWLPRNHRGEYQPLLVGAGLTSWPIPT
jgi:hypothetical protein